MTTHQDGSIDVADAAPTARHWTSVQLRSSGDHEVTVDPAMAAELRSCCPSNPDAEWTGAAVDWLTEEVRSRTTAHPGVAIVRGASLADWSDSRLESLLLAVSRRLGRLMKQNPAGDEIVRVTDESPKDDGARGYRTSEALPLHTDAADVAGLLCLQQAAKGGDTLLASAAKVHDRLVDEAPDLVHLLYRRWHWDRRGAEPVGEPPTLQGSIFSYYRGRLFCRLAPGLLRHGAGRVGRELSTEEREILDRFDEVAARPELMAVEQMGRGDSLWVDNYGVLHGRSRFFDGVDGPNRCYLRSWIWLHEPVQLASIFESQRDVY